MTTSTSTDRMARKRQRDREAGWVKVEFIVPASGKDELKQIVAAWLEQKKLSA